MAPRGIRLAPPDSDFVRRALLTLLLLLAAGTAPAQQSSFESDPFSSRFRDRASFDFKFRVPEKGGNVRIVVPEGDPPGRLTVVGENVGEAEAPAGKYVTVEYQDIKLTARKVRADYAKKTVLAEGDVVLVQGPTRFTGSRLSLDLGEKVGILTDGAVDLEGGIHIKGATLAKVGPKSFTLTDGVMTACDGEKPSWYFSVKSGRVTIDDYARLKSVVFHLGGAPLLYTPYLVWPVLRDRASGFLVPGLGYNSNRGGYLGLSYFWALGRSADATFSADIYTKRFYGLGAEVRVRPSIGTRAEATYYTIYDPTQTRWRWSTKGSIVADDLAEGLRGVVTWLDASDQEFFQDFNRDFTLASTRSLKSEGFLTKNAGPFAFNLRLSREEALFGTSTVTTERRPGLEARLRPTPLFHQTIFVEAEAQASELFADRGPGQPSGSYARLDVFPKVSVPLSPLPWFSLQADLGARLTAYGDSQSADGTALTGESFTRTYVKASLEATGPSISRIYDVEIGPYTRIKHVIEPRLDYDYLSEADPDRRAPLFDEVDSILGLHTLRYSLVQHLLAKGKKGAAREIATLEIGRTYAFELPGEGTPTGVTDPALTRNGPVDATLRFFASSNFNFDVRSTWDTHANQVTSASLTANFSSDERTLNLSLFDSRPVLAPESSAQLRFGGGLPILKKRLRLDVQGNYDLSKGKMLESRALLTIEAACFKILTEYRDLRIGDVPARDFRIALNLKNVGSFLDFTGSLSR